MPGAEIGICGVEGAVGGERRGQLAEMNVAATAKREQEKERSGGVGTTHARDENAFAASGNLSARVEEIRRRFGHGCDRHLMGASVLP
jgi:hypothetical protein